MPLRDLLKKKEKIEHDEAPVAPSNLPQASEFTFIRTDTHTEERISPPVYFNDEDAFPKEASPKRSLFRKSPKASPVRNRDSSPPDSPAKRRLSQRLHLSRGRSDSANLPKDLPAIQDAYSPGVDQETKEMQWEERATRLASKSPVTPNAPGLPSPGIPNVSNLSLSDQQPRSPSRPRSISDAQTDVDIQEAIRLHESGSLEQATVMFATLAERGNVLSQVLYGLSLRHGWGCKPDPEKAINYLSAAASNSAEIERQALAAGMKKGGAAKGELVLAIFELANCFRYGWGVTIDKVAARQYYETAANLGDTDAMAEAAWCYMEGFGGPKDKVRSRHLQLLLHVRCRPLYLMILRALNYGSPPQFKVSQQQRALT
jgi:TPR repeat protein